MANDTKCPVCRNESGGNCSMFGTGADSDGFECSVCGTFEIARSAWHGPLDPEANELTKIQRAALSHQIRKRQGESRILVTTDTVRDIVDGARLPSPAIQATNIIRLVGHSVQETGEPIGNLPASFPAYVGSPDREFAMRLALELKERGLLSGIDVSSHNGASIAEVNLTLDGWREYEDERTGRVSGNYGFLALQFGDPALDAFVRDVLKPLIKESLGYELVDMRDVAEAGLIDNIMRERIRDALFVVADLTHGNPGAYWEAGYAEGLGKPVIYICEKSIFETDRTHFDTNHCTTVVWAETDDTNFSSEMIATLRRSLGIFPDRD